MTIDYSTIPNLNTLKTYHTTRIINSPNAGNTKSSLPISHRRLNTKTPGIIAISDSLVSSKQDTVSKIELRERNLFQRVSNTNRCALSE